MIVYAKVYIFLVAFLLSTAGVMADDSLVLHFTFDEEGDVITDNSLYGNNGELRGTPKWIDGKFGRALEFDGGGDSVEVLSSDSLNVTESITMEMWVKAPAGGEVKQAGIEKGGWEVGEYSLYPVYEGGTVIQFFDLPPACGDAGVRGPGLQDEEWHYLAGTWDGDTIVLYLDGDLVASAKCGGELSTSNQSVHIGSRLAGERYLVGSVDEVRIYNRALTQDEVKKDMQSFGPFALFPGEKLATLWGKVKMMDR
jgi:hypothetical protein